MIHRMLKRSRNVNVFVVLSGSVASLLCLTTSVSAQVRKGMHMAPAAEEVPVFSEYRGIQLGMMADEVRKKLGTPKDKSDEQDFYVFGDTETAQIIYDKTHKVITISADYLAPGEQVPTAKQVLGANLDAKPDGSIYKMVRYPKAGCWLSYNRTAGNSPVTSITLQRIEQ